MKTLMVITLICSLLLIIINAVKAMKWYKKYINDIFEYNKGRGYYQTWVNSLNNCYKYTTWSFAFLCLSYIIYCYF